VALGHLSKFNNSTDAIGSGGAWVGTWEDVQVYDSLTVAVATDQNGYYEIQFSTDGTNADSTLTRYYRTSLINPPHRFTITRRFFRIRFFNTGSAQTYFRLQCIVGDAQPLNVPLGGVVSLDYDSIVTRPTDYFHAVGRGLWQGRTNWVKFGYNPDVDTTTDPEVVWANGAAFGPSTILKSPSTWTITSSSDEDIAGSPSSTGAQSLIIYYVGSDGHPASGTVDLAGTGSAVTSFSGYGINRVAVLASGSTASNVGNITITNTSGGAQAAYLPAGGSVTQQCIFYVGHGYTALINDILLNINKISGGGTPVVTIKGYAYNVLTTHTRYELFRHVVDTTVENTVMINKRQPIILNSSDVFWLTAETTADNTVVSARFALTENRISAT